MTVYTCSLLCLEHVPLPLSRLIVPLAETVHLRVTVYICSLVGLEQVPLPLSRLIVPLAGTVHLIGQFVQNFSDQSDKSTPWWMCCFGQAWASDAGRLGAALDCCWPLRRW